MEKSKRALTFVACLFLAALIVGTTAQPLSAQVTIPQGAIVTSAVFSVYATYAIGDAGKSVTLHKINKEWGECSVTYNSLIGYYDLAASGSFVTQTYSWRSADITALVQAWINGAPNYGFIMIQEASDSITAYWSSRAGLAYASLRPMLEISYTYEGAPYSVTIQRTDAAPTAVSDTYIRDTVNFCSSTELATGILLGVEKYSVVRFNFTVVPEMPGTGTPGYWMNHPNAWPEPGIVIGGIYYPKAEAINLMFRGPAGDMTYVMFAALVAAKLNVLIGNDASCISSTIAAADAWMNMYPVGSGVGAGGRTSPWRTGEPLYKILDDYNNGLLCAPSRDTIY